MSIKLIFTDMDGTLLNRSQIAISRRNMEAIQRALRAGVLVVPCTGRIYDMLPPQLLTQEGLRYFVTCHGAQVYDKALNEPVYAAPLSPDETAETLRLVEGRGLYAEIGANRTLYLEKAVAERLERQPVPFHHQWYMRDRCYTPAEKPSQFLAQHGLGLDKLNLYGVPESQRQPLYDGLTAAGTLRPLVPGAAEDMEFSLARLNKMAAIDALLSKLGIGYDEVMALGDAQSDLAIIRKAKVGVAMGNAAQAVKDAADWVTANNTEDGVAVAIERFWESGIFSSFEK